MRTIAITLAAAMLVVAATPALAQSTGWIPMDITAEVTNIERVHGMLLDEWEFTVEVTNNEAYTIDVALQYVFTDPYDILSDCPPPPEYADYVELRPGRSATLSLCVVGYFDMEPDSLAIEGWLDPDSTYATSRHILAFYRDACNQALDGLTCSTQSITRLIHDIEPESMQCVAPTPAPTGDAPTTHTPTIGTAAYHTYLDDMLLTFDMPVTLHDGWQDGMSILATNGTDNITLDGLVSTTRNLMQDGSTLVWLSLAFSDYTQLDDITALTLRIDPGTIMYGDGQTINTRLNVPVELVP